MKKGYTLVGFGELVVDKMYDESGSLLNQDGGDTTWNILYHLGLMGEKVYAIGGVGNDENKTIAINSLKKANVNTNYIQTQYKNTNIVYSILKKKKDGTTEIVFSEESPFDGQSSFEISRNLPTTLPEELKSENIIVVIMDLDEQNLEFINGIPNKKVALDLGHKEFFEMLDANYILEFLKRVDICQLNGAVVETLLKKLNVSNVTELYKLINPELLIITYGKKGASFLYKEKQEIRKIDKKPIKIVENAIDTSGAGDAFLSVILKSYNRYLAKGKKVDTYFIDNTFNMANLFSCQIIQQLGCRETAKTLENWMIEYNNIFIDNEIEL